MKLRQSTNMFVVFHCWDNISLIRKVATLFTWDFKTASSFWHTLKMQPIMSDDIQCFKALITIHKVVRDGHPSVHFLTYSIAFKFRCWKKLCVKFHILTLLERTLLRAFFAVFFCRLICGVNFKDIPILRSFRRTSNSLKLNWNFILSTRNSRLIWTTRSTEHYAKLTILMRVTTQSAS